MRQVRLLRPVDDGNAWSAWWMVRDVRTGREELAMEAQMRTPEDGNAE